MTDHNDDDPQCPCDDCEQQDDFQRQEQERQRADYR
jgi:hypothetical protein